MASPYEGIATPVETSDPYAGIATRVEDSGSYAGVAVPVESSVIGAAGREVVREVLPTVAGFKGGAWGAARGALWGSRLGPYGALGGGIIGGIAGFIGASAGASKLQELGIKAVVSDETYQGFESQVQADVEQHPWAVTAGSLVPWALHPLGRPNPAALGRAVEFVKGARAAKVAGTGIADYIKTEQGLANLPDFQRVAFGAGTQAAFGAWDSMKQGKFDAVDFGMRVMAGAILTGPSPIRAVVAKEPGGPEVLAGLAEEAAKTPDIPIPEKVVPVVPEAPRIASEDATGVRVATPPPPIVPRPIIQTPAAAVEVPVERPPVAEPVVAPAEALVPTAEAQVPKETVVLPKELAGAKPRYSYGSKQFELTFDSDVDKAAYITAQKTKSKRDADYLKFAMKATGMDEAAVRNYGAQVRQRIKAQAKDAEPGTLTVPVSETMRQGIPAPAAFPAIVLRETAIAAKRLPNGLKAKLSEIVDAPELFAKYPEFKKIGVLFEEGKVGYASREFAKGIEEAPIIRIAAELRSDPVMVVRALVHELTHEVQVREGRPVGPEIAKGLSLEEADRLYRDHPSEQEARRNAEAVSPAPAATEPVKATTPEPPAAVEPRKRGVLSDETRAKNPVAAIIEDNGGVRPYKQAKGQKPAEPKEHYTSIPLRYRAKKGGGGLPADEMLSIVQADHPSIQTVEDMIATLKGKKRLVSEETYYTDQAEGEADWIANRSETIKPDVLGVGDSMKIKGETFRVTEETDSAIRLKDGAEYWLPYESDETLRIDKGSLKHGEPSVPVPPGKKVVAENLVKAGVVQRASEMAPAKEAKPAPGELFTEAEKPFNLIQDTVPDNAIIAREQERAATLKAENAKRQTTMWDDLEKRGKEGLDRINKEGRLMTGTDFERFFYFSEIGAAKIGRGVNNFARWSAEMVKEFGEWIREHLPQIWKQAQALHAEKTKPSLPSEEHTVAEIQEAGRIQVERDAGLGGVDRDSVTPPSEPKPTLPPVASYSAGGQQFRKALDANEATVRNFFGFSWTKARDFMAAAFRDVHRPITRRLEGMGPAGKRIIAMFDRMAGSSPKASLEIQDAIDSVMATLPKTPESGRRLDGIRLAKRVIEATELQAKRGETRTWPKGMSPESARAFLADEAKLLGPEKFKQYEDAAQTVSTAMENQIVKLRDAGLLTPEDAKYILDNHKSYMPLEFLTKIDPDATSFSVLGKKVTVPDSGLQRLGAGDEGALISNWRYLLSQVVQRTDKRIAKNNLNRALYDAAKPGNALGVVTDETLKQKAIALLQQGEMELGAPIEKLVRAYDTLPNGVKVSNVTQTAGENMQPIDVVVDGMTRRMWMHQDLVKYWTPPSHAEISDRVMRIMGWLSGATPVRALATGYNPEFAWRNLFMDAGYNWFRTNEYSTFLPQAFGQRISDLRAVAKDAWNFGPETRAFINEGGSLDFLTQQGSLMRAEYEHPGPHHEFAEKAQRVLSKLNNTSEMMGRLATRRRAILNGSTPAEATLIARNVLDFHKGGFVTKTLDRIGMPYLNAGFRAADGMAQSAVGNPREFAMKAGQLAVFASGLTYWAFRTSPKTMDSIPDREREGFWIIPLGDLSVMDATGKPRYLYMKFRKDQAARAMAAAAETTTERMMGRKVDGNRIWMGLTDFAPADPMNLTVPTQAAYVSYALNKDLWNKEDAWKGAKVSPEQEYTERTPQGYVLASKTLASLGIPASPERMKTAGQRVFPLNGWTALMGGAASWLLPDDKAVRQSFAEELMSVPGIRTVIGETRDYDLSSERLAAAKRYGIALVNPDGTPRPSTRIADEIDAAQITINDRRQILNRTLDNLMARTKTGQETFDSLNAWIQTIPDAAEQKRLHERVKSKLTSYMARVNP